MSKRLLFPQPAFIPPFADFQPFAGLCVGITGHRGVLGALVTERLRRGGVQVEAYPGDIVDASTLATWFSGQHFDVFLHFAALVPVELVERDRVRAFEVNAIGAYRVCEQLVRAPHRGWTFLASTSHVYKPRPAASPTPLSVGDQENPGSTYGRTKLAGEHLCRQFLEAHGYPHCIGRIFSFSHSTQQEPYLVPRLVHGITALAPGQRLQLTNPDSSRDILDAETIIDTVLHLAVKRASGTINVGSGTGLSIADIAHRTAERLGKRIEIDPVNESVPDSLVADVEPLRRIFSA